jgi:cell division protein ZapA
MPQVSLTINGRVYPIACNDGEEERIAKLGRELDGRVTGFARQVGQAGEARLLVLAALVLADELAEAREAQRRNGAAAPAAPAAAENGALLESVNRLAERIEAVADELESIHI